MSDQGFKQFMEQYKPLTFEQAEQRTFKQFNDLAESLTRSMNLLSEASIALVQLTDEVAVLLTRKSELQDMERQVLKAALEEMKRSG